MDRRPRTAQDLSFASCRTSLGYEVPRTHLRVPAVGSSPDWSHLGRRVMAEAWRRTTEELAARSGRARPSAVPTPSARAIRVPVNRRRDADAPLLEPDSRSVSEREQRP